MQAKIIKQIRIPNWNENIEGDNVVEGKTSQAKIYKNFKFKDSILKELIKKYGK